MPRNKRTATRLTTTQVAHILGISTKTLYRMLLDGRIPEPQRNPLSNYRIWDPVTVQIIRDNLEGAKSDPHNNR
jgi:predicted site-specific integrase-resolvase